MKYTSLALLLLLSIFASAQEIEFLHAKVMKVGKIMQGKTISSAIEFKNIGDAAFEIDQISPSCGCTAVTPDKMLYEPGETAKIPFTIETKTFSPGVIRKSIRISFKDDIISPETIMVEADLISELSVNPRYIHLQKVVVNPDTTISDFFEIENESEKPIQIKSITVSKDFLTVKAGDIVIPPGKSHLIKYEFKPAKVGRLSGRITIESDHETISNINVPIYINVVSG